MNKLQLEVGKTYQVRDPDMVGSQDKHITIDSRFDPDEEGFEFLGSDGCDYKADGRFRPDSSDSDYDLVKEV